MEGVSLPQITPEAEWEGEDVRAHCCPPKKPLAPGSALAALMVSRGSLKSGHCNAEGSQGGCNLVALQLGEGSPPRVSLRSTKGLVL